MFERNRYWVWLSSITGVSNRRKFQLIRHFGHAQAVWWASREELKDAGFLSEANIESLMDKKCRSEADKYLDDLYSYGIEMVAVTDGSYPESLMNIYDPPVVLYLKGRLEKYERCIGIVGSRMATPYGMEMAEKLAEGLSAHGITVVSGMARGIDSCAHKGALKTGGRTIAVLGCGLDSAYPVENKQLMGKIAATGAVISEYLPGVEPLPHNFPMRNRIISGMSDGIVVVEAGEKSGSLITADFALEQGRDVFAVPGNANSSYSTGTNRLIKEGARVVTGISDILEELNLDGSESCLPGNKSFFKTAVFESLADDEKKVALELQNGYVHIDSLAAKCGFGIQKMNSILVMLELRGIVEQMPGKIFKLK